MIPFTVTFYSFKGGVGRTVLAANIAALLARFGKTLLWDLDIEAPGLHRISDLVSSKLNESGFFEWLLDWQDKRKFDPPTLRDHKDLLKCLLPVGAQSNLFVLPAFGEDANFADLYQQINWPHFLAEDPDLGLKLFRGFIEFLGEQGFRYLVLDSRTGITDIGGFLAALLPHVTVLIGNYGVQNTAGLRAIWPALQAQTESRDRHRDPLPPLRLELVASPIPIDDPVEERELRAIWAKHFALTAEQVIHIPESPVLRRTEKILALHGQQSDIVTSYGKLATRLQAIDNERQAEDAASQRTLAERPDLLEGRDPRRSRTAQGKRFEERVADLLRLLGYRIEPEQTVDGVRVDLIATMTKGLDETVYFVECKDRADSVGSDVVTTLYAWLDTAKARALGARGMVVAHRFSPQAQEYAKSKNIRLFTPEDLERALIDFSPYLNRLVSEFATSPLAACYIDQYVQPEKTPGQTPLLLPHAATWASGEGNRLWVLLGDYGTGKTTFTKRFAYDLAQRALGDPTAPIPLLINLRDFPNKASLADVLHEHWAIRTNERRDPQIFQHLLQRGRVVLLLDSFDEMGVAQAHRNVVEQFRGLVYPTGADGDTTRSNRILVTCREQYFRDKSEAEQAVTGRADSLEKAARSFDGAIDLLPRFTHEQIQEYLRLRMGKRKGAETWTTINNIYNLKSLADRPQLLDIIIDSLPRLVARGGAVNAGALYLAYTNQWLEDPRIRPSKRQSNDEQLRRVLETLAGELWRRDGQRIHHSDLFALLKKRADLRGSVQVENLDVELRTAAFLSRTPEGNYGFSHRSFLEFFYARSILLALTREGDGLAEVLDNARLSWETAGFVGDLLDDETLPEARKRVAALLANPTTAAAVRGNVYLLAYSIAIKRARRTDPKAMADWLPKEGAYLADCDLVDLDLSSANFSGADLSRCRLDRSRLQFANLHGARLTGASLIETDLTDSQAMGANFSLAHAERAQAIRINLENATLIDSSWVSADLAGAVLEGADFSGARLRAAHLAGAVGSPHIDGAFLDGLTWAITGKVPALRPTRPWLVYPWLHFLAIDSVAFSPDSRRCLTGSFDNTARLWDVESGICLLTFQGHQGTVTSVAFSPDGRRYLTGSHDNTVRLWDAKSGNCLLTLQGHRDSVTSVAFSPDGHRCLTGSVDNTARLWDAETGSGLLTLQGHQSIVTSVAFSPDGHRCLTGSSDNTARLWDVELGSCLLTLQGHLSSVTSVSFSPDGRRCLTGSSDDTVRLWDTELGGGLLTLRGDQFSVSSVAFSPDGRRYLTGNRDNTVRLWDVETGDRLLTLQGHQNLISSVAFSPDGYLCLTGSWDNTARLWDAQTGSGLLTLQGYQNRVTSVTFSPDGRRCLTGSLDNTARLWDAQAGSGLLTLQGHQSSVTSVAFSPDGRRCLTGSVDNTARLWDVESGSCLRILQGHQNTVTSVAFSPDGCLCLTGSWDSTARLWDTKTGDCLLTLQGHHDSITSVAFSPDGRRCLTGSWDNTARLWDSKSGDCLLTLQGHQGWVTSVAFSPDGHRCLTGSRDNTARLWDSETGACLAWFWAEGDDWFILNATQLDENGIVIGPGPLLLGAGGRAAQRLKLADAEEKPGPWPWIPRQWPIADFPELLASD
ncbi:dynein assembly factor with WDR repeat domains 1 [Gammaproteobacteria bacterium]